MPSNEASKEIPKARYISPQERQQIIDEFRTKNWVEINNESRKTYNVNCQIKFKTTMLRSSLCDYIDSYFLIKEKMSITGAGDNVATKQADETGKRLAIKNCAPFTNCISEIKNTQVDNAKDIDIVMPVYNLIEYSENIWKFVPILQG